MKLGSALGQRGAKQQWKAGRQLALKQYVIDLMDHPGTSASGIVHAFVQQSETGAGSWNDKHSFGEDSLLTQPGGRSSTGIRNVFAGDDDKPPDAEVMALAGVRARLVPDKPGTIEVTVRADGEPTGRRVQILRRPLDGVGDEGASVPGDYRPACEELDLQTAEGGMSEVALQLTLPPGTTWEIAAREVNSAGIMGTNTSLRLQVPTDAQLVQAPAERMKPEVPSLALGSVSERSEALGLDDRSSELSAHDVDSGNSTESDVAENEHHRHLDRRKTWAAPSDRGEGALRACQSGKRDSVESASLAIKALNAAAREQALAAPLTARGRLQLSNGREFDGLDAQDPNALLTARGRLRTVEGADADVWSKSDQGWARRRVTIGVVAEDKDLKPPPDWAVKYR